MRPGITKRLCALALNGQLYFTTSLSKVNKKQVLGAFHSLLTIPVTNNWMYRNPRDKPRIEKQEIQKCASEPTKNLPIFKALYRINLKMCRAKRKSDIEQTSYFTVDMFA